MMITPKERFDLLVRLRQQRFPVAVTYDSMNGYFMFDLDQGRALLIGDDNGPWQYTMIGPDEEPMGSGLVGFADMKIEDLAPAMLRLVNRFDDARWQQLLDRAIGLLEPLTERAIQGPADCESIDRIRETIQLIREAKGAAMGGAAIE